MPFHVGEIVCVRVDPSRFGPVLDVLPPFGEINRYRVFHSATSTATYAEDQLDRIDTSSVVAGMGLPGTPVSVEELRARLTAAVLQHPRSDDIYALTAARIEFIPFQFRPLTRLLRADRPRLLIADEVGVGKTIEAGLILKELSARSPMDNVLIACPKSLTYKWQQEMRRFDEHFRIIDAAALKYCLKEARDDGAWPAEYARAIVHYELLRGTSYLEGDSRDRWPGFLELDPPPAFNLVIADEAHHLRSTGTNSHRMAQYLGEISEALVLLSATPLQLGSKDLFTLLNLLRPEVFNSLSLFDQMLEPNAHLSRSAYHLRRHGGSPDWRENALEELDLAVGTAWGARALSTDPRVHRVREVLTASGSECDDHTRVQCLHDVEELNTLGHVMNRTRRRDIGRFTTREPLTVKAPFTPHQRRFYDALLDSRREILESRYSSTVVRLILDSLERQASSCLPALARSVDRLVAEGRLSETVLSDDPELQSDEQPSPLAAPVSTKLARIADLARALPDEDPKLDHLMTIIDQTRNAGGPGKVLLFSFFLGTLDYLAEKVRAAGIRVGIVTGRVPDDEREDLRMRFKLPTEDDNAIDLLMSSEVGCEGLDYQFCDRLVNYDIPWNPMRVEQRIGRIDRFGQQSEKVLIYNFITPDTVEDRIYFRCWERLGVFRDAIGDLESVLGDAVEQLNQIALDRALSPEQAAEQAQQVADNVLRRADEDRRLEESAPQLLGFDQLGGIAADGVDANGRFVTPGELEHLVARFLSLDDIDGELKTIATSPRLRQLCIPSSEGRVRALEYLTSALPTNTRAAQEFARWARSDDPVLVRTFDQQEAVENRSIDFITPLHPVIRAAINAIVSPTDQTTMATHLAVIDPVLPLGTYLFAVDTWEVVAIRPGVRTACTVVPLGVEAGAEAVELALPSVLAIAIAGTSPLPDESRIQARIGELDLRHESRRRAEVGRIREENSILLANRLASLAADHEARSAALTEQIAGATNPKIARMRDGQRARLIANYRAIVDELESRRDVDVLTTRLCTGILEVHHA